MRSKKALINIITTLILNFVSIVIGFIIPNLIIKSYGSSVNGLTNSITQFLGYISLLEVGVGPIIIAMLYKPISENSKEKIQQIIGTSEKFFRKIAVFFIVYLMVLLIIYPVFVKDEFDYIFTITLIVILAISTFFEYFFGMTSRLVLEALQKKYIINLINIITAIFNCIGVVVLVKLGFSIHMVKFLTCLIFITRPIFLNLYIRKKYNLKPNKNEETIEIKDKKEGFSIHLSGLVFSKADIVLLTLFANIKYVSIYSIYNLIVTGINNLMLAFTSGISSSFGDMIARQEKENLNRKFSCFETIYLLILSIIISCMFCLIIPFIAVYTKGITDANYIQPSFAMILCVSTFFYLVKSPYSTILYAGGFFKEMHKGGWVEAILNVLISVILVIKYNIVGVAIGTLISVFVRTIELIYLVNRKVLNKSILMSMKKLGLSIFIILVNSLLYKTCLINLFKINSYFTFIKMGLILGIVFLILALVFYFIFYKEDLKNIKKICAGVIKK